jgi:glyoxylase-like metal-dependent hydrolase (beta-lactamase superfamily II)/rhodanese-related sulfurtransferase
MFFKQIKVEGLGCLSYVVGCPKDGRAFVVDPKRDIDDYLKIADENGLKITGVIDTHIHADHISGSQELKAQTGATIYVHENADVEYEHSTLKDGDQIEIGNVKIDVIYTPGHTPNAVTLAVTDKSRGDDPELLLTGDLLFVGSVGRPDLAGGELLDEQINNLHKSLHEKLGKFPDLVEIYPAHGEGSLCGSGMSAKPSSTLGYERKTNPFFKLSFDDFKNELNRITPFRPKNFTHIITQNKKGASLLSSLQPVIKLKFTDLKKSLEKGNPLVDLRDTTSFGGAHIAGSINIGLTPKAGTWLGTVVDPENEIALLAYSKQDIDDEIIQFRRVGYDRIIGFFIGLSDWIAKGEDTGFLPQLSIHGLNRVLKKYSNHHVIDVRTDQEWNEGHIKGAIHLPLPKFINNGISLEKEDHISMICGSGYRSNIAASILKSKGFEHVYSVIGGMNAWKTVY